MRRLYKYALMMVAAITAGASFTACDDDDTDNSGGAPSLEIGTITVSAAYEATTTLTAKGATAIYWGYAEGTQTPSFTKIESGVDKPVTVTTPALAPGNYTLSAYAENAAGKSKTMTREFTVSLDVPALTFGEATASRAGISVPVTVVGAEEEIFYSYVLQEGASEPAVPEEETFKSRKIELMEDGNLVIAPEWLDGNGTWWIFAYAENANGKSPIAKTSVAYDETKFPKLVEFEIANLTAYSVDVKVKKLEGCTKYVVGGFMNGAFTKNGFITSAKQSLNPDPVYPMQPYNWSDKDATFPERLLIKNRLATDPGSDGMAILRSATDSEGGTQTYTYQIAVYAEDADGNGSVYTLPEEFQAPDPVFGNTPTVTITAETSPTQVIPTFKANGDCAKMVIGFTVPEWYPDVDWKDDASITEFLSSILGGMRGYDGTPIVDDNTTILDPNMEVVVYAIPITADGKLGKLCYERFKTDLPAFDGAGSLALEFKEATIGSLTFNATLTDAKSVRILCVPVDFFSVYEKNLEMTMYDPINRNVWKEFTAAEISAAGNTVTFERLLEDTEYVLRAVTIDAQDKISPVQSFPNAKTLKEGGEVETGVDFSKGKGQITFNIISEERTSDEYGSYIDLTYSVTKGANTVAAYRIPISEIMLNDMAAVEEECKGWFSDPDFLPKELEFDTEITQGSMSASDPDYGGSALAIVTKDTDGNFKIAYVYFAK